VAKSRKASARDRAFMLVGIVVLIGWYAVDEFRQTHWRSGLGALCTILAFVLWLVMTKVPSHCGVQNKTKPGNCRNPIDGLFFGCGQAKNHTWQRPLAFVGLGRKRKPTQPRYAPARQVVATPAIVAPSEAIQESPGHRVLFYATLISTTFAVASGVTDVLTFFDKTGA
jgi:hypothetical protein